jgi:hypothetical protein
MQCQRQVILLFDRHATHVTPRLLAYTGSQRIIIIQLVAHSSHLTELLDQYVFAIFKVLGKKENKVRELKAETLKICRGILQVHNNANDSVAF